MAAQLPAVAHDTEVTSAPPPASNVPKPGTSIAAPQVLARATASGAAHHTAAAPARTITAQCRRIGSPRHVPGRANALTRRLSGVFARTDTLARQKWPEHKMAESAAEPPIVGARAAYRVP